MLFYKNVSKLNIVIGEYSVYSKKHYFTLCDKLPKSIIDISVILSSLIRSETKLYYNLPLVTTISTFVSTDTLFLKLNKNLIKTI